MSNLLLGMGLNSSVPKAAKTFFEAVPDPSGRSQRHFILLFLFLPLWTSIDRESPSQYGYFLRLFQAKSESRLLQARLCTYSRSERTTILFFAPNWRCNRGVGAPQLGERSHRRGCSIAVATPHFCRWETAIGGQCQLCIFVSPVLDNFASEHPRHHCHGQDRQYRCQLCISDKPWISSHAGSTAIIQCPPSPIEQVVIGSKSPRPCRRLVRAISSAMSMM